MSNLTDYEAILPMAQKAETVVESPNMPVGIYAQEAEDLFVWSSRDKAELMAAGITENHFTRLNEAAGALRYAQSLWIQDLKARQNAEELWSKQSPEAFDLVTQLLHAFRYAYRNHADILTSVQLIAEGSGAADMIQDLSDLSLLGKNNTAPLLAINFDMALLDKASELSAHMADVLAQANGEKADSKETLQNRNQIYSFLKLFVDDIRSCGKYLFWRDEARLKGYRSEYFRKLNAKK